MARVAVASVAVTLTLGYIAGAAAVVAAWSPDAEVEPKFCGRTLGSAVIDL